MVNKKIVILAVSGLVIALIGLFTYMQQHRTKEYQREAMVQFELGDHAWLREAQQRIKQIVNKIIIEEMEQVGFYDKEQYLKFVPKKRFQLTVYGLGRVATKLEPLLVETLTNMQKAGAGLGPIEGLEIGSEYDWFGDDATHLVVKIDDSEGALRNLRADIRQALVEANERHERTFGVELYSIPYAERFPFVPHVDLGRFIRFSPERGRLWNLEIEKLSAKEVEALENIKKRVLEQMSTLMQDVAQERDMAPDKFVLKGHKREKLATFDLKQRE